VIKWIKYVRIRYCLTTLFCGSFSRPVTFGQLYKVGRRYHIITHISCWTGPDEKSWPQNVVVKYEGSLCPAVEGGWLTVMIRYWGVFQIMGDEWPVKKRWHRVSVLIHIQHASTAVCDRALTVYYDLMHYLYTCDYHVITDVRLHEDVEHYVGTNFIGKHGLPSHNALIYSLLIWMYG